MDPITQAEIASFTDWHVDVNNPGESVIFPGPIPVPKKFAEFVRVMTAEFLSAHKPGRRSFRLEVGGLHYRVQMIRDGRFAARTLPGKLIPLDGLRLPVEAMGMLMDPGLKTSGGLMLLSGLTGSGKTWTAAAAVAKRLQQYGGYCLAVEDPPEVPIEGFHGNGYCEQVDVSEDGYHDRLVSAMRCFPAREQSMLFFGEVRDPASAAELLRIAVDGHLVVSTIHAKDNQAALQRLLALAQHGGEPEARALLSSSLKLCAHQSIASRMDPPLISVTKATPALTAAVRNGSVAATDMS